MERTSPTGRARRPWGEPPPTPHTTAGAGAPTHAHLAHLAGPSGLASMAAAGAVRPAPESPDATSSFKRRRESTADTNDEGRPLAITCTPCRSRKIKCDSKKPTCNNCAKNPQDCVYPVKLKPGLRPGTGIDMTKRMEQMEERLQQYETRLLDQESRLLQLAQWQQQQQHAPPTGPTSAGSVSAVTSSTPGQFLSISTPVNSLPPQPYGRGDVGVPGFSPADLPRSGSLDLGSFNTNASPGAGSTASFLDPHLLPPDDVVRDLIALYFSHIAPWAPIIRPQTFNPPWNIIVYAIVVVTMRLSNDPRIASTKQQYRQTAKSHVLSHAIESTSISSVQALALLALDLIGSEQGPSSWGILALLTRSAVHLGLITEDEGGQRVAGAPAPSLSRTSIIPPPANWQEDESRRRLFWLIFCLDRYACVSTGWDFALPDFEIRRRLPCSDVLWEGTEWFTAPLFKPVLHRDAVPDPAVLSPMAYLVEALDLLGRAHTLQSRVVEPNDAREVEHRKDMTMTLTSAAKRWFADLPLKAMETSSMTLVIQAIYHATLLKLNAYYAFPALSNGVPIEPYGATCMASGRALAHLCGVARDMGFRQSSSPLFIWGTWVAARVLFVNAFLAHANEPGDEFDTILAALKDQAPYWSLASENSHGDAVKLMLDQYVKLLERAKRKWASGTDYDAAANPSLPDAIHVLLDLRRTAYSAVGVNGEATPHVSPPDVNLSHLPAWAVQPLLGDLHNWFDLPAGLFADGL